MSVRTKTTFMGYICDKCAERWDAPPTLGPTSDEAARAAARAAAAADGWAAFVGRSLRHYCPGCAPSQPSGRFVSAPLHLIWGEREGWGQ